MKDLDDEVCLCFHVSRRKLLNFTRVERPVVASQLAQCGGAGTGCGWCVPYLRRFFAEIQGHIPSDPAPMDPEEYRRRRAEYLRSGQGKPPRGIPEPDDPPTPDPSQCGNRR